MTLSWALLGEAACSESPKPTDGAQSAPSSVAGAAGSAGASGAGTAGTLGGSGAIAAGKAGQPAAGAGGSSGGGSSPKEECPATPPTGSCSGQVVACAYPTCCGSTVARCVGGDWTLDEAPCPVGACPPEFPTDGAPCSACPAKGVCKQDLCATEGTASDATCVGGVWHVSKQDCDACGKFTCKPGEVCLQVQSSPPPPFDNPGCIPNPCPSGPLSCDCGVVLCTALICSVEHSKKLSCVQGL